MAGEATTISALENPSVPQYDPLARAQVPQPPATIITTGANGPNGSVDNGGQIDRIAAAALNDPIARANAFSQQTFGMPFAAPSLISSLTMSKYAILGAAAGALHGYRRGRNKGLTALGYGLAGFFFPLLTFGVAAFQGYGQARRR